MRSTPRTRISARNQAPLRFRAVRHNALQKGLTHLPMTPIHPQDRPESSLFLREKGPGPKSRPTRPTAHSPNDSGAFRHIPPLSHFATIPTPALPRECNCGSGSEMGEPNEAGTDLSAGGGPPRVAEPNCLSPQCRGEQLATSIASMAVNGSREGFREHTRPLASPFDRARRQKLHKAVLADIRLENGVACDVAS